MPNHSPTAIRTVSLVILSPSAEQGKALSHAPDSFLEVARRRAVVLGVSALRKRESQQATARGRSHMMAMGQGGNGGSVSAVKPKIQASKPARLHHDQGTHWSLCCLRVAGEQQWRLHQLRLKMQTVQDKQHSLYPNLHCPLVMMLVTRLDHQCPLIIMRS